MYSKEQQTHKKRIKPTQKSKGSISSIVRKEVKERSNGVCERCMCKFATQMAHITSRKQIEHKTRSKDLIHVCIECHKWLDETAEGIRWKRGISNEDNLLGSDGIL